MTLFLYRPLREIDVAGVWPPADPDWAANPATVDPSTIPKLEFDFDSPLTLRSLSFYVDIVDANGAFLDPGGRTFSAQLIPVANPREFITTTDPKVDVATSGLQLDDVPFYSSRTFFSVGPGSYGLRIFNVGGADPGADRLRVFMRLI